ncbi:hypothetical protein IC229_00050 [Spirosoma sp. BT702]|uniref:Uncharacterized protein n=1 Tax=Spirosoma profusum TaxID=2771354 RepID=A0A926XSF8_9BACT|nr:hypothetical protein [Spirosoma profusum]MBD2699008.1 hypothetical protein [Spirosoma profusum]
MKSAIVCFAICLFGSVCFGQADSSKTTQEPVQKQVFIPGVDTPTSGPGLTAQVPTTTPPPPADGKKRKALPPSDPRSFGVSVPIGKAKKDSLRKN